LSRFDGGAAEREAEQRIRPDRRRRREGGRVPQCGILGGEPLQRDLRRTCQGLDIGGVQPLPQRHVRTQVGIRVPQQARQQARPRLRGIAAGTGKLAIEEGISEVAQLSRNGVGPGCGKRARRRERSQHLRGEGR
jgi:hypothetical protein